MKEDLNIAETVLKHAKSCGATDADVLVVRGHETSVRLCNRSPEQAISAQTLTLGLRIFSGDRQALISISDINENSLLKHVKSAYEMAKLLPEDKLGALSEPFSSALHIDTLSHTADYTYSTDEQWKDVHAMEETALHVPGVTSRCTAEAGETRAVTTFANSRGFRGQRYRSYFSRTLIVMAGNDEQMERDYDSHTATTPQFLNSTDSIAMRAANLAVSRLNGRSIKSCQVPVIFPPRWMRHMIGLLLNALSGQAVANKSSFLANDLGSEIFSNEFSLVDDPLRPHYTGARQFDCEGNHCQAHALIEEGVLKKWLLDHRAARQLGLSSLGHAQRGLDSQPSPGPSTLFCPAGPHDIKRLVHDFKNSFEVSELIGSGFNPVTGDFSFGASGIWLEKGSVGFPVQKVTLAGNLKDLFKNIMLGNQVTDHRGINTPTGIVEGLTIGGTGS